MIYVIGTITRDERIELEETYKNISFFSGDPEKETIHRLLNSTQVLLLDNWVNDEGCRLKTFLAWHLEIPMYVWPGNERVTNRYLRDRLNDFYFSFLRKLDTTIYENQ